MAASARLRRTEMMTYCPPGHILDDPPRLVPVHQCRRPLDLTRPGISDMLEPLIYSAALVTALYHNRATSGSIGLG